MLFILLAAVLIGACFFGGATSAGFPWDVFVQLLAVPLLLCGLWSRFGGGVPTNSARRPTDILLVLAALLFVLVAIMQLVPLPPLLLAQPGASQIDAITAGGLLQDGDWRSISLTRDATWAAAVSAIPALAVCLGMSCLDASSRLRLVHLVIALGAVGLLLGFLQVANGAASPLRFYEITNPSEAVGFFANRNHFAAQLYTTFVFAAVWFGIKAKEIVTPGADRSPDTIWLAIAAVVLLAMVAGLALARSRAGLVLGLAALIGVLVIAFLGRSPGNRGNKIWLISLAALISAVLFALQFGLHRMTTRFDIGLLDDMRLSLWPATFKLALENLPYGSGLGSFVSVYAASEKTEHLMGAYANRAHNDWAEFFLETGIFGVIIAALFLSWFAARAITIWNRQQPNTNDRYLALQRGATLVIALLLMHSAVDYPLRTTSMGVIFAFACGLLLHGPEREPRRAETPLKRVSDPRGRRAEAAAEVAPARWGADIEWPDEWKNPPAKALSGGHSES